jgi:hypothetical protein
VFRDGDDVGASHFSDGHAAVGLVGSIEVDVVGSNTGCDGDLELLGFCETFSVEVAWVETTANNISANVN